MKKPRASYRRRGLHQRGGNARPDDLLDRADPEGLARLLDVYLEDMAVKNHAERTINGRRLCLAAFLRWCQERDLYKPRDVTRPVLESYQRWMHRYRKNNGKPLGITTQRSRLVAIKEYFRWLCRQNLILHNPASELEMPRSEKKLPVVPLTEREVELILALPDLETALGLRDRTMMEVLYSTAIRRVELIRLEINSVHFERGTVVIRQGKGKKDRFVPIGERALSWIEKYLHDARPELALSHHEQTLFLSAYGDAIAPDYLTRLIADYVKRADLGRSGSCHIFRHTCATLMLENGADIRHVQQMLGHANLSTTQIYTDVSIRQLQKVHAMTHPAVARKAMADKPARQK